MLKPLTFNYKKTKKQTFVREETSFQLEPSFVGSGSIEGRAEMLRATRFKVILISCTLLFVFIAVAPLYNFKHEPSAFAFENSDSIKVENPYHFETANVYKGQLHCHTTNSDGTQSPSAVANAYKNAGYNFLVITDHDYVTPDPEVEGILFITGNEVSSSLGHISTLNVLSVPPSRNSQKVVDWTKKTQGGLVWLAHPNYGDNFGWTFREMSSISGYDGIEVYNSKVNSYAEEKWDYVLTELDRKITAIAVDDCHDVKNSNQFNGGWVMVFADSLSKIDIINSLEEGNFYSTQGPIINTVKADGNTISIKLKQTSNITWIGAGGSILQETTGVMADSYAVRGNEKYVRIRVESSGYAWTNPIYISKLVVHSTLVSDSRVNPSQFLTVSGQICDKDKTIPPANGRSALKFMPDSYVQVNRNESLEPIEMSFSLWVKFDGYDAEHDQTLISKKEASAGYFVVWNATAKMIRFYVFTDGWRFVAVSPPAIGEWCHLVGTYAASSGKLRLYVNGSLADEVTIEIGGILHSLAKLTIGAIESSNIPDMCGVNGTLDDIVLDDRAWNQAEVSLAYQGRYPEGTILYLPFDGDTQDHSGQGNHGAKYKVSWTEGKKVNVQVYIDLNGETKASLSVIDADGSFTFPTFPAESSVDLYNYNVYAVWGGQVSFQNQTVKVIVDGLKVSAYTTNLSNDQIKVRVVYAYDGTIVQNGNVTYAGFFAETTADGWATFNVSSLKTVGWGLTAYAISEPEYGLTTRIQNQTVNYEKILIDTFTIKADNPITNIGWSFLTRELSFNSSGTTVTDVGDLGKPIRIKVDGETFTDWTYNSTTRQVTARNVNGKVVLQWTPYVAELWIIGAVSVGLAIVTAAVLLKKTGITSFSTKQHSDNSEW
jgi:hypothetical protein